MVEPSGDSAGHDSAGHDSAGNSWLKVLEPRPLIFPADHGPHPDYRIEWWYYTGNLETVDGRRFGYQLTFFRTGMRRLPSNPSRWAVSDLYTAHFAIADVHRRQFHRFERTSRGGIGWAGAEQAAQRVWNGNWELSIADDQHRLAASQDGCALQLSLHTTKAPVLHGDGGLSRKGAQPGNASYYYSFTRLETRGQLTLDGVHLRPEGRGDSQLVLMLWAYHVEPHEPIVPPPLDEFFPDVVLRGMSAMIPGLRAYFGKSSVLLYDGGYYTRTPENRPLAGPLLVEGAYVCGAVSGYGLMASAAVGELVAAHVTGGALPDYAPAFSIDRYDDPAYRRWLENWQPAGQL